MASWTGLQTDPTSLTPRQYSFGPITCKLVSPSLKSQYKMIGYYVAGAAYETWTSYDVTDTTPPSGHTLTNVTAVRLV